MFYSVALRYLPVNEFHSACVCVCVCETGSWVTRVTGVTTLTAAARCLCQRHYKTCWHCVTLRQPLLQLAVTLLHRGTVIQLHRGVVVSWWLLPRTFSHWRLSTSTNLRYTHHYYNHYYTTTTTVSQSVTTTLLAGVVQFIDWWLVDCACISVLCCTFAFSIRCLGSC